MIVGWFFAIPLYNILEGVVKSNMPKGVDYVPIVTTLPGPFMLKMKMAFYIGIAITLPFTVHQLWGFIAPGLRPNERRPFNIIAPISTVLFFMGMWTCWYILPTTVYWFASFTAELSDAKLMLEVGTMVFLLVHMMLSFGLGFQLPLVVFFLARLEIITTKAMMKYWRHAIVGIVTLAAMITPSGNPISLAVLALPLIGLFFGSVYAAQYTLRKKRKKEEEDEDLDELDDLD